MVDSIVGLQIGAALVMFIVSLAGVGLPFMQREYKETDLVCTAKSCSAGVMLSLALVHLLGEANEMLEEEGPDFPLSYALTTAGVVLVLAIEQFTLAWAQHNMAAAGIGADTKKTEMTIISSSSVPYQKTIVDIPCTDENCEDNINNTNGTAYADDCGLVACDHHDHDHSHSHTHEVHEELNDPQDGKDAAVSVTVKKRSITSNSTDRSSSSAPTQAVLSTTVDDELDILGNLLKSSSLKDVVTCYIMEMSIAIHSFIIGVDLGLLGSNEKTTLITLIFAIAFHQFIEGVGLGTTISASRHSLGSRKLIVFVGIFSSTISIGIILGIVLKVSHDGESRRAILAKGVANCFAAGSLLYISLTEMVSSYFANPSLAQKPLLRVYMVSSFALGCFAMTLLAIWA